MPAVFPDDIYRRLRALENQTGSGQTVPFYFPTATDAQLLIYNGTAWVPVSMSGDATMNDLGVVTVTAGTGAAAYGDGSDGDLVFDGSSTVLGIAPSGSAYTLTRDILATNLTVSAGATVKTRGFRVYCRSVVTVNSTGAIHNNGNDGGTGANPGAALSAQTLGGSAAGANGAVSGSGGATGSSMSTASLGGNGGNGGSTPTPRNAGPGGTVTAPSAAYGTVRFAPASITGMLMSAIASTTATNHQPVNGGAGGGGGGCDTSSNSGAGGGGGGVLLIAAHSIVNNGTISANGGNGGNASGTQAGGGGGGGGGVVILTYDNFSGNAATATGGTHGTATGSGTGGTNGSNGTVITVASSSSSGGSSGFSAGGDLAGTSTYQTIEEAYTTQSQASAATIDFGTARVHRLTLTGNVTITLAGPAASRACGLTLYLIQDGTGSRTVTWPGSVKWPSGTAPTLSTAASSVDIVVLESTDGGTTWYGNLAGKGYA